jgi:hypothetical protein
MTRPNGAFATLSQWLERQLGRLSPGRAQSESVPPEREPAN